MAFNLFEKKIFADIKCYINNKIILFKNCKMFLSTKIILKTKMRLCFGGEMVHYKINCKKMFCMSENYIIYLNGVQRMDSETPIQIEMDK